MKTFIIVLGMLIFAGLPTAAQDGATCTPLTLRPVMATHTLPPYPTLALRLGEEGTTTLKVTIGVDGTPTDVTVNKSSGALRLDNAAATFVKAAWRWLVPVNADCNPVAAVTLVNIAWDLKDSASPLVQRYTELDMTVADYPAGAVARGEQGYVTLLLALSMDGRIANAAVNATSGFPDLDARALEIVKARYRWKPAELNGKPVVTTVGLIVVWTLPLPGAK